MSNTIDKRVVEMGFNNQQFESGVKTSLDSINTLKKGLEFNESYGKGLGGLSNLLRGLPIAGIGEGVANISSKFSILGVMGFTAIQNITNSVIGLGKKLWDLVSPIKAAMQGLSEYEIQINAVQTILANTSTKGTSLNDVNAALDQLNTYADKTIYNFGQMTKNIGTFTAAGIDLDTSVAAIKGIANLAAISGSNSQQASTAMYQLSQALSTGSLKLMDWNSVVNAGMGGQIFQDALKETARAHGVAVDKIIKDEGSFRDSLTKGWITSSILTETLSKFTGDLNAEQLKTMGYTEDQITAIIKLGQVANDAATKVKTITQLKETLQEAIGSGWAKSWQIVLGDFDEAKALFTEMSDTLGGLIGQSSEARNTFLEAWKHLGGRLAIIEALRSAFSGILTIVKPIGDALKEVFPPIFPIRLVLLTVTLGEFAKKLNIGAETADKVKRIFRGLFSIFDIIKMAIESLLDSFLKLVKPMAAPAANSALNFLVRVGDYLTKLRSTIKANDSFRKGIEKIGLVIGALILSIKTISEKLRGMFDSTKMALESVGVFKTISGVVTKFVANLITTFKSFKGIDVEAITEFIKKITGKFTNFLKGLGEFIAEIGRILGGLGERIKVRFGPLKELAKSIGAIFDPIIAFLSKELKERFKKSLGSASTIGETIVKFFELVKEAFSKIDFSKFSFDKSADAVNGILTGGLLLTIINFIRKGGTVFDGLKGLFGTVKGIADSVKGATSSFTEILDGVTGSLKAMQENLRAGILQKIAISIGILALSLGLISLIDSKRLTVALIAITTLFTDLFTAMAVYQKVSGGPKGAASMVGAVTAMIAVAAAMLILAITLKILASEDPNQLMSGITALSALIAVMVLFVKSMNGVKLNAGIGIAMLGIAVSIMLMSTAIGKLGNLKPEVLQQGLIAIGAILAEIALFSRLSDSGKSLITSAIGLIILSGALILLVGIITKLGSMKPEIISQGLTALAASLVIIGAAMNLLPKDTLMKAVGLVIVAAALVILAKALGEMGKMGSEEITKSLTVLAGAMLILVLAMTSLQGAIPGALALLIIVGALILLTGVLKVLGGMKVSEIAIALGALAAIFLILGIAGYALAPVVPVLLALGAAMLLIGIAIGIFGAGVVALSIGIASLAVTGAAGATAIVAMIAILLGVIPLVIAAIVGGLLLFATMITAGMPTIQLALQALITMVLNLITNNIPVIIELLDTVLKRLILLMRTTVPDFIDALLYLIGELLSSLAEKVPEFVQSGIDIIMGLLKGIRDNIAEIVTVAIEIVTNFIDAVADKLPDIIDSGFNLIISFINGLADGIDENVPELQAAIGRLATAIVEGLANGLSSGVGSVAKAIGKLAGGAIDALKTLLGIFSPSRVFTIFGELTGEGFANGIINMVTMVEKAAINMGSKAVSGITGAVKSIKDSLGENMEFAPTIRPVVDLTEVISGGKQIAGLLNNKTLMVSGVANNISSISNGLASQNTISEDPTNRITDRQGSSISLTQINNSPTALSRLEIYRQTRNQMLMLKGLVKTSG